MPDQPIMPTIETFYYHGTLYIWHHEPQKLYEARHITIYDAVQVITRNDSVVSSQCVGGEERYKPESAGNPYWESKGVRAMPGGQHAAPITDPEEIELWNGILANQNHPFTTSGRGSKLGIPFTYSIRGAEMFVSSRSKSITRATILYAYRKVKGKQISGPKAIGVHGDSYIYAIFKAMGVIT